MSLWSLDPGTDSGGEYKHFLYRYTINKDYLTNWNNRRIENIQFKIICNDGSEFILNK